MEQEAPKSDLANFSLLPLRKITLDSYLSALLWCLRMYHDGRCPNYSYCYPHQWAPDGQAIRALGTWTGSLCCSASSPSALHRSRWGTHELCVFAQCMKLAYRLCADAAVPAVYGQTCEVSIGPFSTSFD